MRAFCFLLVFSSMPSPALAEPIDFTRFNLVDLSHNYNANTIYWPTERTGFELESESFGMSDGGYFYSANRFSTPEHGGTHLDAPVHFAEQGWSLDEIPIDRFFGSAIVIDVSAKVNTKRDYRLSVTDVEQFEKVHGRIGAGTMVLMRTDYSRLWTDRSKYLGSDKIGDASDLHFPGFGEAAAQLLIQDRQVKAIGIDTASIDYGQSKDFIVHRIAGKHNILGFENLTDLEQLSPVGSSLIALPMKIGGGSGGPLRIIALVPK